MSVSTMEKLTVIAPKADADAIVRRLMRQRAVSLAPLEDDGQAVLPFEAETDLEAAAEVVAGIEAILPILNRRSKRKKPLFAQQAPLSVEDFVASGRYETTQKVGFPQILPRASLVAPHALARLPGERRTLWARTLGAMPPRDEPSTQGGCRSDRCDHTGATPHAPAARWRGDCTGAVRAAAAFRGSRS